jgi:uncharacterized protein (TIGR00255 family)
MRCPDKASLRSVLVLLVEGRVVRHYVTLPEGWSSAQAVEILNKQAILTGTIDAIPEEASLWPDTYEISRGETRASVIARMRRARDENLARLWAARSPATVVRTPEEAMILASIVEKETGVAAERPRVAAVFTNRLRSGMRLESDPTIEYGITRGVPLRRGLRRSELDRPNPMEHLSDRRPAPDAHLQSGPGRVAAVLNPPSTSDLFFVADGSGGHAFARTYEEHLANVARWRVNGRSLDVKLKTPPGLDGLDREGREAAQARFQRGQVGITVQARRSERAAAIRINAEVLAAYREVMANLVAGGASAPTADGLLGLRGVLEAAEADDGDLAEVQAAMARDLAQALDDLKLARRDEGARLVPLILGFLDRIADLTGQARQEADAQTLAIRERFTKRVEDLTDGAAGLEDRIFQEAAMMAARADVREELDRLDAHTASGRALVAEGGAVGRRLDFLTQEFMREANTLCSKAATLALTSAGLDLKATIEQLREQVQNVE